MAWIRAWPNLSSVVQVYRRTYSWAQTNDDASRGGAFITITRTPVHTRMSEEDLERGCSADMLMDPQVCPDY